MRAGRTRCLPIDINALMQGVTAKYFNAGLTTVNDHVVRMSVMTEPYYWHSHPNSDESFLVLEGRLLIEMEDEAVTLTQGQMWTVPAGRIHRTSPVGERSVNLTFESQNATTERAEGPSA